MVDASAVPPLALSRRAGSRVMESSTYLLDKAEQCRRMAASIVDRADPVIASLLELAAEFEAHAITAAIREGDAMKHHHPPPGAKPDGADDGG